MATEMQFGWRCRKCERTGHVGSTMGEDSDEAELIVEAQADHDRFSPECGEIIDVGPVVYG